MRLCFRLKAQNLRAKLRPNWLQRFSKELQPGMKLLQRILQGVCFQPRHPRCAAILQKLRIDALPVAHLYCRGFRAIALGDPIKRNRHAARLENQVVEDEGFPCHFITAIQAVRGIKATSFWRQWANHI